MSLAYPLLLLFLPLPFLLRLILPSRQAQQGAALRVPFFTQISRLGGDGQVATSSPLKLILMSLIWSLLLIAAARPQWLGEPIEVPVEGRNLMLAVDVSGSMKEEDMVLDGNYRDRLSIVKNIAEQFIDKRVGDRVGLILFGTNAYIQAPLSFDRKTVNLLVEESQIGIAGEKTAIGDAIGLAVKRLREIDSKDKVLILLTDGENTAGSVDPIKAGKIAAEAGLKIYTIGIGADEAYRRTFFGMRQKYNPSAGLDEKTLKQIAADTGARYFRARSTKELEEIYHDIDKLEPVVGEGEVFRPVTELYYIPLVIAYLLTLVLAFAGLGLRTIKLDGV
ncbi:MAG: VWA domain-containing protein [Gammaproteobacteria bacterium]|nr:MAG: VWA domain-containing protein [Gammaproteobacteria bacterium]